MDSLGCRIKELRKAYALTQDNLGAIVGLHGSNIGRIEKGTLIPTADVILKMADYFNVSCDYLLKGNSANMQISSSPLFQDIINSISDFSDAELTELKDHIGYMIYKKGVKLKSSLSANQIADAKMA